MRKKIWLACALAATMAMASACSSTTSETGKQEAATEISQEAASQAEEAASTEGSADEQATAEEASTEAASENATEAVSQDGQEAEQTADSSAVEAVHIKLNEIIIEKDNKDGTIVKAAQQYVPMNLTDEDAALYPELQKTFDAYNTQLEKDQKQVMKDLLAAYKEMPKEESEAQNPYSQIEASVLRADSRVVSIYHAFRGYYGGTHGSYSYTGLNYDTQTGQRLALTDVVKDTDTFFSKVKTKLQKKYADSYEDLLDLDTYLKDIDLTDPTALDWAIDSEGVTIYFNPEVLGSYADGAQIITINFNGNEGIFEEKYTQVPDQYVINLVGGANLLDVDGDGSRERVTLTEKGKEDDVQKWIVKAGDQRLVIDDECYYETNYVVHANDQYYMYIFETGEADYSQVAVVNLKDMTYDSKKSIEGSLPYTDSSWDEEGSTITTTEEQIKFTDPTSFELARAFSLLSTFGAKKTYYVDAAGYPASDDTCYQVPSSIVLKTKAGVTCDQVDEAGQVVESAKIKKDTYLTFVRTDGESYVDLQEVNSAKVKQSGAGSYTQFYTEDLSQIDPDQPIYRVYVKYDKKNAVHTVNDKREDKLFEGIAYAG